MTALDPRHFTQHPFGSPVLVAAALALLTYWLAEIAGEPLTAGPSGPAGVPDAIVENARATAFDAAGQPRHHLLAERIRHYPAGDRSELDEPRFRSEQPGRATWRVSARRGELTGRADEIHLHDEVDVERRVPGVAEPIRLATQYLLVHPDAETFSTDHAVRLRQGSSVVDAAGGLRADGKARTLELIGRVKGIYENPR